MYLATDRDFRGVHVATNGEFKLVCQATDNEGEYRGVCLATYRKYRCVCLTTDGE